MAHARTTVVAVGTLGFAALVAVLGCSGQGTTAGQPVRVDLPGTPAFDAQQAFTMAKAKAWVLRDMAEFGREQIEGGQVSVSTKAALALEDAADRARRLLYELEAVHLRAGYDYSPMRGQTSEEYARQRDMVFLEYYDARAKSMNEDLRACQEAIVRAMLMR